MVQKLKKELDHTSKAQLAHLLFHVLPFVEGSLVSGELVAPAVVLPDVALGRDTLWKVGKSKWSIGARSGQSRLVELFLLWFEDVATEPVLTTGSGAKGGSRVKWLFGGKGLEGESGQLTWFIGEAIGDHELGLVNVTAVQAGLRAVSGENEQV